MDSSVYNMGLRQFKEIFADQEQAALGDEFCIVDVRRDDKLESLRSPVRLDAYIILICLEGSVRMSVNMNQFVIEKDEIVILIPGYIGKVVDYDESDVNYVVVGVNRNYLSSLNLDLNRLFAEEMAFMGGRCVKLGAGEKEIYMKYLDLAKGVMASSFSGKRECLGSLISSLFYLSESLVRKRVDKARDNSSHRQTRADDVFNRFLGLLAEYHTQERNVGFYAEKLCLSPKYFSKLIKSSSGRSAPDWIDSYVIMEAQNYLKYSDMSIKEIVFRLHFSDQPTFTKFFKAHTGLTPVKFRKS